MKFSNEIWREDASCKKIGHKIFFSDNENSIESKNNDKLAKSICRKCIVRPDCLNYALNEHIPFGIWGGLSSRERNAVIKKLKLDNYYSSIPGIINQTIKIKEKL